MRGYTPLDLRVSHNPISVTHPLTCYIVTLAFSAPSRIIPKSDQHPALFGRRLLRLYETFSVKCSSLTSIKIPDELMRLLTNLHPNRNIWRLHKCILHTLMEKYITIIHSIRIAKICESCWLPRHNHETQAVGSRYGEIYLLPGVIEIARNSITSLPQISGTNILDIL